MMKNAQDQLRRCSLQGVEPDRVGPATVTVAGTTRPGSALGFTFTEMLFAVIILGVGFIMLASMFPTALSQTKQSLDESAGTQAASGAVAVREVRKVSAINSVILRCGSALTSIALTFASRLIASIVIINGCAASISLSR